MPAARWRLLSWSVASAWLIAASAPPCSPRSAAGEITGVVRDQAGARFLARPSPSPTSTPTGTRTVTSSGDGVYTAPSLPPGDYRVDVELAGFKPMRRAGHPSVDRREGARSTSSSRSATCASR